MFLNKPRLNLLLHLNKLQPSFSLIVYAFKMSEFHFEDPDLTNSTLKIGFPSCAIGKDNFIDSQGKPIRTENKEYFQDEVRKQRAHLRCRCNRRSSC